LRLLTPLAFLSTAAAVVFVVSLAVGWWEKEKTLSTTEEGKMLAGEESQPPIHPVAEVASVSGKNVLLVQKAKQEGHAPKRLQSLFRGDRLHVQGKDAEIKLRFHEDALVLTLVGDVPGGTEVLLGGDTNKAYGIRLERGLIKGVFSSGPIEKQMSRWKKDVFTPLYLTSPVAKVEVEKGQEFEARQDKTQLWKNTLETFKQADGVEGFNLYFDGFPLRAFLSQHIPKILPSGVRENVAVTDAMKLAVLGRGISRAAFPPLMDDALSTLGLRLVVTGGTASLSARPGGPLAASERASSVGHGAFTVTVLDGRARLATVHPVDPGTVRVFGGQIGRVRPGLGRAEALSVPPLEMERLADGTTAKGVFVSPAGRWALFERPGGGAGKKKVFRVGDMVGGHRLDWVGWESVTLVKNGREIVLPVNP
jgi:hypothetical protein